MDSHSYTASSNHPGSNAQYTAQQSQPSLLQQRPADSPQESNTLPPINGLSMQSYTNYNNGSLPGSVPGSMPQTPITPHTPAPGLSSAPSDSNGFSTQQHQNGMDFNRLQASGAYQQMMPMYSTAPIASTLAPAHSYPQSTIPHRPNDLLPRPAMYPQQHMQAQQQYALQRQPEPEPTHVVGQQGRRGVLPTAPNRPPPTGGKFPIPPKNSEGKFPCPHCAKTYLHAKHLKRHMLRRMLAVLDLH